MKDLLKVLKEQVIEIERYCNEHGITRKQRSKELGLSVSIRLRTTCIFDSKWEATCSSCPKLGQVDSTWFVLPTCPAGVHGGLRICILLNWISICMFFKYEFKKILKLENSIAKDKV